MLSAPGLSDVSLKFSWSQLQNMWICVTSVVNFNQRCHRISWSSNYSTTERSQSNTSAEMEFFNGIFSRVFWAYTRVFQDSSFFLVFYHHFAILQNTVHEYIRVFLKCFANFFVFEKHGAKYSRLLLIWCPRIPSLIMMICLLVDPVYRTFTEMLNLSSVWNCTLNFFLFSFLPADMEYISNHILNDVIYNSMNIN